MDLTDAHVLVTGASRGVGAGLAREFRAKGARVTLAARSAGPLQELATELKGVAVVADLTDADDRGALIARVEEQAGPVDVLVNNAGIDATGALTSLSPETLSDLVSVNLLAPMELTRQVLPGMVPYSATKAGLTHFTAGLRAELRGLPIGTTVLEVGLIPTDMKDSALGYAPTAAAFRRFYRLGLLADTSLERVCGSCVAAVASGERHVRLPRRARAFAVLAETPRRMAEIILSGVPPR